MTIRTARHQIHPPMHNIALQNHTLIIHIRTECDWSHGDCIWLAGRTIRVKWQIVVSELLPVVDTVQLIEDLAAKEVELKARMLATEVVGLHE